MAYLKSRWRSIAVFAVFSVIFATIFMLYHIPLYAVRDGALLCLFFGGVCLVVDAASFTAGTGNWRTCGGRSRCRWTICPCRRGCWRRIIRN